MGADILNLDNNLKTEMIKNSLKTEMSKSWKITLGSTYSLGLSSCVCADQLQSFCHFKTFPLYEKYVLLKIW